MNNLPKRVTMVEVSPRDGLQNEANFIPTDIKVALINRLSETGLQTIEATSFVSPTKIPQLADCKLVYPQIKKKNNIHYPVLIPNLQGLKEALSVDVKEIAVFSTVSETFAQKNINCSIDQSLVRIQEIMALAREHNIAVRGYISCVLGCPYEGAVNPTTVAELAEKLLSLGCYQISLGDTIGIGTPGTTVAMLEALAKKNIPFDKLAVHFHDTYGQALANIYAALQHGVSVVDSSVAGLGGCPYAKGATGNVASEDLLYLLNGLGIETGVDLQKLIDVGNFISAALKQPSRSKVAVASQNRG